MVLLANAHRRATVERLATRVPRPFTSSLDIACRRASVPTRRRTSAGRPRPSDARPPSGGWRPPPGCLPAVAPPTGMLFHERLESGSRMWFEQMIVDLSGPLSPDILEAAWRDLSRRHPALRSGFVWEGVPRPLQVCAPTSPPTGPTRPVPPFRGTTASPGGSLHRGRPAARFRSHAGTTQPGRTVPLRTRPAPPGVVGPSRVVDGWCQSVMVRDLTELCRARVQGESRPCRGRPVSRLVAWLCGAMPPPTRAIGARNWPASRNLQSSTSVPRPGRPRRHPRLPRRPRRFRLRSQRAHPYLVAPSAPDLNTLVQGLGDSAVALTRQP